MKNQTKIIGYAEFVVLLDVEYPAEIIPGLCLREDGVWVMNDYDECPLAPAERAALTEHPLNDRTKPVLKFPCSVQAFDDFLNFSGMRGALREDLFDAFLKERLHTEPSDEEIVQKLKNLGQSMDIMAVHLRDDYGWTFKKVGQMLIGKPDATVEYNSIYRRGRRLYDKGKARLLKKCP
ncbi:MAG: hypothetical protein C0621_06085 [Desulfuromonas sp.]|nr:MAG: hypothetical protein C0621_06085 [Desulfuromonas sp.]